MSYDPGAPGGSQPPGGYGGGPGGPPPYGGGGYGQQPPPGWGPHGGPGGPGGPGGYGAPGGPAGLGGAQMQADGRNFFAALFDYSFSSFATPGLIRVLYIIGTVLIGLGWLFYTISFGFLLGGALAGLLLLIFGGIGALFALAFLRINLEFYYAVVRMSEDIHNRR
jgi:hypothetical protein